MGNTTRMYRWNGSSWALANQVYYWNGSAWVAASRIWRWDGSAWIMCYSTPVVSCSNVSGTNSGNAVSGFVSTSAASPSIGGGFSGSASYAWTYVSGNSSIACSNSSSPSPSWSITTSAGTVTAVWQVLVTDTVTGATTSTTITVSCTWVNTESPLSVSGINGSGSYSVASGSVSQTVSTGENGPNGGCTPSGGSGSYTYSWSYISGDSGIGISSSSAQNPTWSKFMSTAAGTSTSTSAIWQISLTDSEGHGPVTAQVTISLTITSNQPPLTIGSSQNGGGTVEIFTYPSTYCSSVATGSGPPLSGVNPQAASVTPSGGTGSYNYSWTYVSGDSGIACSNASISSPTFSKTMCTSYNEGQVTTSAVWQCAVTDSGGNGPVTVNLTMTLAIYVANT